LVIFDGFLPLTRSKRANRAMIETITIAIARVWESLLERLIFLPPLP
jgi:hypothetical protein